MRYIKKYNFFESIKSELDLNNILDMDDILMELVDDGFFISHEISDFKKVGNDKICNDVIEITIDNNKKSFNFFSYRGTH